MIKITLKIIESWLGVTWGSSYPILHSHLGHYGNYYTIINDSGRGVDIPPYACEVMI